MDRQDMTTLEKCEVWVSACMMKLILGDIRNATK